MKESEEGLEARPESDKKVEQEEADEMQVDGRMQVENNCMQAEKDQMRLRTNMRQERRHERIMKRYGKMLC